jgi:dTDP-4-amino-4,6-dideoxygalactose transaminase
VKLPLLIPALPEAEALRPYLERIDSARRYTNFGPLNAEFEGRLALHAGSPRAPAHVVTTANATLALELALRALGLPAGARVAVPALTFVATATAVRRAGLEPAICDVDPASWCLTPALAARAIEQCEARAVIPVATFGAALDPGEWDNFGTERGVPVLVDAAGAFGSQQVGKRTDVVYSFHATKSFGIGEGGALASADPGRIAAVRKASNFGIDVSCGEIDECGTNAKLSEYHAAVGLAVFDTWDAVRAERAVLAARYRDALVEHCPWLGFQLRAPGAIDSLMPVLLPAQVDVAAVRIALATAGVETRQWYCPPLHQHPALRDCPRAGPLTASDRLGQSLLGLPYYRGMQPGEIDYVGAALARAAEAA